MDKDFINLAQLVLRRKRLRLSYFSVLVGRHFACFRNFFRTETLKHLRAFAKGSEKVEKSIDVRKFVSMQTDI